MEPLAAEQVGDGCAIGVGVIVVKSADCVMVKGALMASLIDCEVVTDALITCMMVTGASSSGEDQVLTNAAAGGGIQEHIRFIWTIKMRAICVELSHLLLCPAPTATIRHRTAIIPSTQMALDRP